MVQPKEVSLYNLVQIASLNTTLSFIIQLRSSFKHLQAYALKEERKKRTTKKKNSRRPNVMWFMPN